MVWGLYGLRTAQGFIVVSLDLKQFKGPKNLRGGTWASVMCWVFHDTMRSLRHGLEFRSFETQRRFRQLKGRNLGHLSHSAPKQHAASRLRCTSRSARRSLRSSSLPTIPSLPQCPLWNGTRFASVRSLFKFQESIQLQMWRDTGYASGSGAARGTVHLHIGGSAHRRAPGCDFDAV